MISYAIYPAKIGPINSDLPGCEPLGSRDLGPGVRGVIVATSPGPENALDVAAEGILAGRPRRVRLTPQQVDGVA